MIFLVTAKKVTTTGNFRYILSHSFLPLQLTKLNLNSERLKTPPATPLFQSLEMDAIASQPAVQRELPIVPPLSRVLGYNFHYCSDQLLLLHTEMFSLNPRIN